jgi:hypothetical protein
VAGLLAYSIAHKAAFPFPVAEESSLRGFAIAAYSDEFAQALHLFPFSPKNVAFSTPTVYCPNHLNIKKSFVNRRHIF